MSRLGLQLEGLQSGTIEKFACIRRYPPLHADSGAWSGSNCQRSASGPSSANCGKIELRRLESARTGNLRFANGALVAQAPAPHDHVERNHRRYRANHCSAISSTSVNSLAAQQLPEVRSTALFDCLTIDDEDLV